MIHGEVMTQHLIQITHNMAKDLSNQDIEAEAIALVRNEKNDWKDATVFVTNRVSFMMRNLIKQLRKNYWGVFNTPKDPITGRQKIWTHLTKFLIHSVTKNIDLDTKDIDLRAKRPDSVGITAIARSILRNSLEDIAEDGTYFGEELDMLAQELAVDGTVVWKTFKEDGKIKIRRVDLLNCYIDPTVRSIDAAYRFTERVLMNENEVKEMTGWMNTEEVQGISTLARVDEDLSTFSRAPRGSKLVDVWELWGMIPESLITGKDKDKDNEVFGKIVVSGIDQGTRPLVHEIKKISSGQKPYEEAWYKRKSGRWYGEGVAEMVMWEQLYTNIIRNIRITRGYVSQLGLFKIRKGSGITPQSIGRLSANGAIPVNNMDDIEQLIVQEASQASYQDEANSMDWAQRVTQAFETVTGEPLPASTTATSAVIQSQQGQSAFTLIKEQMGMFLQRWLKRHYIPLLMGTIDKKDLVRLVGESEEIRKINELIANKLVMDKVTEIQEAGEIPDPQSIIMERQRIEDKLNSADSFIKLLKSPDLLDFDVLIQITNENIDKGVLVQNLLTALQLAPQFSDIIIRQVFDIMGLDSSILSQRSLDTNAQQEQAQIAGGQTGGLQQPTADPIAQVTEANTI